MKDKRKQIDAIDDKIMKLLEQRFEVVEEIKAYKQANNISVVDNSREEFIYNKTNNYNYQPQIKTIYQTIIKESCRIQDE